MIARVLPKMIKYNFKYLIPIGTNIVNRKIVTQYNNNLQYQNIFVRGFGSSLPNHRILAMPSLSPTM